MVHPLPLFAVLLSLASSGPSSPFAKLEAQYLDGLFRAKPHLASYMGNHDYERKQADLSSAGASRRVTELRGQAASLKTLDRATLTQEERIDADIMADGIALELLDLTEIREQSWNPRLEDTFVFYDPREYVASRLSDLIHGSLTDAEKLSAVTAQLSGLPLLLEQKEALLSGPVTRVHLDKAVKDNLGRLEFMRTELEKFTAPHPAAEKARLAALSALQKYQAFLEKTLPARATRDWRLGPVLYRKKFPLALQTDLTVDEFTRRARAAFAAAKKDLVGVALKLAPQLWPHESLPKDAAGQGALVQKVRDELSRDHPAANHFVEANAQCISGLRAFIEEKGLIGLPPADSLTVEVEPEFKRGAVGAEYLSPGFLDSKARWHGTYYVDPVDPTWPPEKQESYLQSNNNYSIPLTASHEAYPGHHVQAYYARRDRNPLRATLWSGPFAEGWAVYGENQVVASGYGGVKNDRFRFMNMLGAMTVAGNALLDAGLQGGAMTDEEAMHLLVDESLQGKAQAEKKILRAKLDSTQLSQYFLGFSEIQALEAEVRARGKFNQRSFNEGLVGHGTVAVKRLRTYLLP